MNLKTIKILMISAISYLTISPALAGPDGSPFEGLYLGLVTTKNTFETTASYLEKPNDDFPSNFTGITSGTSKDSYGAGMLAGYGLNYGPLYLGAEAAFIIDKGHSIYSDGSNTIKINKSNTFDINGRVGFTLADKALVFGLIGYSGLNLKSKGVNEQRADRLDYNTRVTAFQYGGGVEVAIMENIALRAEYTRQSVNDAVYRDGSDEFTFKPKTSRILVSAVLHMY
ncbi:outer membrane protein [Pseudemcibacter aquimaris]|uniref:outer membrane protein n=1 Tax=Pseudemcibacter aquimaris TaxID=2857064 RepID=UPI0020112ECC|nr:outer membrane beta-barrel protein [Pseudemcibacter aquimaris]MCC3861963.1 outer membrane beta-barrel protein [Pseudemcibacter aquimaris]WDU58714.1 outer membrane beta-barrel protein [Pseudemcibacter aquimaris]